MKNCFRMLLSVCAAVVLTAAAAAVAPPAEPYPTGISGEARWTLQGDTMYVTGEGLFSGVSHADYQPWEFFEEQIRHVVVADGVTLIGDNIFAHTYNLETVTIADSVTEICEGAFRNCYGLKTVKLPAKLQTLGNFAFAYCEQLESVELPDTLTAMGEGVFTGCSAMAAVKLPAELYEIRQTNFDACMSLTEVTIPAGVGFLRHASFSNCFHLKKVVFEGDQPHTNGDPFYMGPEDLTVYCYADAKGWDDPLFYTYPVVKLDRAAQPPVEEKPVEVPDSPDDGGEKKPEEKPIETTGGETEKNEPIPPDAIPGATVPVEDPASSSGSAVDLPMQAEDAIARLPESPSAEQPELSKNPLPGILIAAAAVLIGCVVFVSKKRNREK